jgi:hypothetical protein
MSNETRQKGGAARRPFSLGLAILLVCPIADAAPTPPPIAEGTIRIATWNISFFRRDEGALGRELSTGDSSQPRMIAAVLQKVRPDLLLLNEFDYDTKAPALFQKNYLEASQAGGEPLRYSHSFIAPSNTGVPSGLDFDRDGKVGGGGDALGFGVFPGQYGMLVLSRFPIDRDTTRTFRSFLWRDMPGAILPPGWYSDEALAKLPLSSKSHWDVAVRLPTAAGEAQQTLHFLVSHPTPPGFDGPEDRNGRRNHDEIRLWAAYIDWDRAGYLVDDSGRRGGLDTQASFVIAGDLNADPVDGGSVSGAIAQLLEHPRVHREAALGALAPRSVGAVEAAARQGGANLSQRGNPAFDTGDFSDGPRSVGNLRVDYVLPSKDLEVCASGVFWPKADDAEFALVNDDAERSSDHRLVWLDIALPGRRCPR